MLPYEQHVNSQKNKFIDNNPYTKKSMGIN